MIRNASEVVFKKGLSCWNFHGMFTIEKACHIYNINKDTGYHSVFAQKKFLQEMCIVWAVVSTCMAFLNVELSLPNTEID